MQFTNGDRFIPMRFKPENIELNAKFINNNEEKDILNTVQNIAGYRLDICHSFPSLRT